LVNRVFKVGHDSRFKDVKVQPARFLMYWTIQGAWVFLCLLPLSLVWSEKTLGPTMWSVTSDIIGAIVFSVGLIIESVADYQKWAHHCEPSNRGKFITSGLWSTSRHPNYFGEILVWLGVYLSAFASLTGSHVVYGALSPCLVFILLSFMSGIPILEEQAQERWGGQPDFQEYTRSTPILIPYVRSFDSYLTPKQSRKQRPDGGVTRTNSSSERMASCF